MKVCCKCKKTKELDEYHRNKRTKDGRVSRCKECANEYFRKHSKTQTFKDTTKRYRKSEKGKTTIKKYEKEYNKTEKRKGYRKRYRQRPEQKTRIAENNKEFFSSEKGREYMKEYRKKPEQKARSNYNVGLRRARKKQACPNWLTEEQKKEMKCMYIECQNISLETGISHHVDHILPLKGKTVSGLHVPWNLRIITAKENTFKNNRLG